MDIKKNEKSISVANQILKEKYGFGFVNKMKIKPHSLSIKRWDPDSEDHNYLEAVNGSKLYKIKVLWCASKDAFPKSTAKGFDYTLALVWRPGVEQPFSELI